MRRAELPAEMQTEDFEDTACRYCGVSYVVMSELREIQDRVIRAEAVVEGWRDRISRTVAAEAAKEQAEASAERHRRQASALRRRLASLRRAAAAVKRSSESAARSIRATSAEVKCALQATGLLRTQAAARVQLVPASSVVGKPSHAAATDTAPATACDSPDSPQLGPFATGCIAAFSTPRT